MWTKAAMKFLWTYATIFTLQWNISNSFYLPGMAPVSFCEGEKDKILSNGEVCKVVQPFNEISWTSLSLKFKLLWLFCGRVLSPLNLEIYRSARSAVLCRPKAGKDLADLHNFEVGIAALTAPVGRQIENKATAKNAL